MINNRFTHAQHLVMGSIPYGPDTINGGNSLKYIPYQSKIDIYDRKCSNCGFAYISIDGFKMPSLKDALIIAQKEGKDISRECDYSPDFRYNGECVRKSLIDIICNGCDLWLNPLIFFQIYTPLQESQEPLQDDEPLIEFLTEIDIESINNLSE